jgi:hypothetical protein
MRLVQFTEETHGAVYVNVDQVLAVSHGSWNNTKQDWTATLIMPGREIRLASFVNEVLAKLAKHPAYTEVVYGYEDGGEKLPEPKWHSVTCEP